MIKKLRGRQSYIFGALIISVGGFISKMLGALYRIPLLKYLGGEGMGIYQMVYPLYCILLTVSASGIPTGVARLIASGKNEGVEKSALKLYGVIGVLGSLLMFGFSNALATIVGERAVINCCRALSPSVFFVSIISVIRGYFQGGGDMLPTALTEICEQLIKVGVGCAVAYYFRADMLLAVTGAVFAVSVSEAVTALIAIYMYAKRRRKSPLYPLKSTPYRSIFKYTVPLTFTALAMPLSQFVESIVAVRLLKLTTQNAVALYGIFSGCAVTVINLPVSLTYGLAAAGVPEIAPLAASGNFSAAKAKCYKCLLITLAASIPCAVGLAVFAPLGARLIFGSLVGEDRVILIQLIRIMAINAVTLSIIQTSSACLTALGKPLKGTLAQWLSAILRVGLSAVLLKNTSLSVKSVAISANCAYLLAVLLNIWYIISSTEAKYANNTYRIRNGRGRYFLGRKSRAE